MEFEDHQLRTPLSGSMKVRSEMYLRIAEIISISLHYSTDLHFGPHLSHYSNLFNCCCWPLQPYSLFTFGHNSTLPTYFSPHFGIFYINNLAISVLVLGWDKVAPGYPMLGGAPGRYRAGAIDFF